MTEQKRRGRPPKVEAVKESVAAAVASVGGEAVSAFVAAADERLAVNAAQAYADRVWAGQSISETRAWRVGRVKAALEGQGLPFDGVELPE